MKLEEILKLIERLGVSTGVLIVLLYQFFTTQEKLTEVIINNTVALERVSAALK
jgi:hypothetical protein